MSGWVLLVLLFVVSLVGRLVRWLIGWWIRLVHGGLVDSVVELLDGWMVGWEIGRRIRWMT